MATKGDDDIQAEEGTFSVAETKTVVSDDARTALNDDRVMSSSGDEIRSTDDDRLAAAQAALLRNPIRADRPRISTTTESLGTFRLEAGKNAKDRAAGKLMKSSEKSSNTSKFILVANNMTDHDLVRSASSGSDSWPFSSIKKFECVAALYDHSNFNNINVVFTATDDKPGIRTVMLSAHWTERGRSIGIYTGMTQPISVKTNREKIHDHELDGNKAAIINPGSYYIFEYDINQLQYAQFGVPADEEAAAQAVDSFQIFNTGSLPRFTVVIRNLTGHELTLAEKYELQGTWPLGNIKKGECAVAGFDRLYMSLAARYTAYIDQQKKSISLAGSWPSMGSRKIFIGEGMKAIDAWKRMSTGCQNWPVQENGDDRLNSAHIEVKTVNSGKTCVYVFVLQNI